MVFSVKSAVTLGVFIFARKGGEQKASQRVARAPASPMPSAL